MLKFWRRPRVLVCAKDCKGFAAKVKSTSLAMAVAGEDIVQLRDAMDQVAPETAGINVLGEIALVA